MKRPWHIPLLLGLTSAALASDPAPYTWRAPLLGAWTNGALYVAPVTAPVFDGSRGFPADLRIYDDQQNEWPFYVAVVPPGRPGEAEDGPWVELARQDGADPELREGVQSVWCDVGHRNLPLRRLKVVLEQANQDYPVKVYGRATPTNAWRWLADGGSPGQARATVELRAANYRYLKVELYHPGQPPPSVAGLQAQPESYQLVFEAGPGGQPFLYFGADRHPLPLYDLARRAGPSVPSRAAPAALGERARNPAHIAALLRRYGRHLAVAMAGLLAGFGAMVLVNVWRRRRAPGAD